MKKRNIRPLFGLLKGLINSWRCTPIFDVDCLKQKVLRHFSHYEELLTRLERCCEHGFISDIYSYKDSLIEEMSNTEITAEEKALKERVLWDATQLIAFCITDSIVDINRYINGLMEEINKIEKSAEEWIYRIVEQCGKLPPIETAIRIARQEKVLGDIGKSYLRFTDADVAYMIHIIKSFY